MSDQKLASWRIFYCSFLRDEEYQRWNTEAIVVHFWKSLNCPMLGEELMELELALYIHEYDKTEWVHLHYAESFEKGDQLEMMCMGKGKMELLSKGLVGNQL